MHATTQQDNFFLFSFSILNSSSFFSYAHILYTPSVEGEPSEPSKNYSSSSSSVQKYPNSQSCGGLKAKSRDVCYICLIVNRREVVNQSAIRGLLYVHDNLLCTGVSFLKSY